MSNDHCDLSKETPLTEIVSVNGSISLYVDMGVNRCKVLPRLTEAERLAVVLDFCTLSRIE